MAFTGPFPVYNLIFKVNKSGLAGTDADLVTIADMETFQPKIDGSVENWTPMTTSGWARSLMTGKKFSISLKGKRNVGDPGNDYVADCAWKDGLDCSSRAEIDFPDGSKLAFDCVVDVKTLGDDSTKVTPLEFDLIGDGKPTYTPGAVTDALALSVSNPVDGATAVAVGISPTLTFNNKLAEYAVTLINATTLAVISAVTSLDGTGKILTIDPDANLAAATHFVIVLASAKDIYGHELKNTVIDFTTA